jgi:hypothetical protein
MEKKIGNEDRGSSQLEGDRDKRENMVMIMNVSPTRLETAVTFAEVEEEGEK